MYASVACTAGSTMTCATLLKHRQHTLLYFMEFEQINLGGFELGSFFLTVKRNRHVHIIQGEISMLTHKN